MNHDMTQHIHESNLIELIDNSEFDTQSMVAWDFLKAEKEITHGVICKVQKLITLLQADLQPHQRGYYRSLSRTLVYVGGRTAPHYSMVDALMNNFVLDMKDWANQDPKDMHVRFEHAHPFADGNGRTGRMLMWWHEIKLNREPTLIKNVEKQDYYKWFQN